MKRAPLFHPRVFDDQEWAAGYYKRNARNIARVGRRLAGLLRESGFESGRILDSGCGFGAVMIELAQAFPDAEIVGCDLAEPLLDLSRTLAEKAGVADRVTVVDGDVEDLAYPDGSFDVVVNTFMVHIVDEPTRMLDEIERVARPDARILITDLRRSWLGLLVGKLRTAYTLDEGRATIMASSLRTGRFGQGPYWWDFLVNVKP